MHAQNFYLPSDTHWSLLGFQRSQWSHADEVSFTVNITVVGRKVWDEAFAEYPALGEKPGANWSPAPIFEGLWNRGGYWHCRIGEAMDGGDKWWALAATDDITRIGDEVIAAIRDHGVPAMLAHMTSSSSDRSYRYGEGTPGPAC